MNATWCGGGNGGSRLKEITVNDKYNHVGISIKKLYIKIKVQTHYGRQMAEVAVKSGKHNVKRNKEKSAIVKPGIDWRRTANKITVLARNRIIIGEN
jgi:hypothetical protein